MHLLTENNEAIDTDQIGTEKDIYYCVLDFTRPRSPDYSCESVVVVDTYQAASSVLEIGPYTVVVPMSWSIMVSDNGICETIPIEDLVGNTQYNAFCINPLNGYIPQYLPIRVVERHRNTSWTCPSMKKTHMLVSPIGYERDQNGDRKPGPLCIMICESKSKIPEAVDSSVLW